MKATRKVTAKQFKATKFKRLQHEAISISRELNRIANPISNSVNEIGVVLDKLTEIFATVNNRLERYNSVWEYKMHQIKVYRAWVAETKGNEGYLRYFDDLPITEKMAMFEPEWIDNGK